VTFFKKSYYLTKHLALTRANHVRTKNKLAGANHSSFQVESDTKELKKKNSGTIISTTALKFGD
jgi:hypothetical protein